MFTCLLLRPPLSSLTSLLLLWRSCSRFFPGQLVVCYVQYSCGKLIEVVLKEYICVKVCAHKFMNPCTSNDLCFTLKMVKFCLVRTYSLLDLLSLFSITVTPTLKLIFEHYQNHLINCWYRPRLILIYNILLGNKNWHTTAINWQRRQQNFLFQNL